MSGYDQLSRAAYRAVDLEANERLVMAHIEQHFRGEFTRAELAKSMGWAINRITGRVVSLRDKGLLTEDKSRTVKCKVTHGDAHPLKNAVGRNLHDGIASSWRATDAIDLRPESAPAAPYTTPPSPSNESADVFSGNGGVVTESAAGQANQQKTDTGSSGCISTSPAAPLIAVVPCIGYMEQISIETAKRILKDPKNAFFKQAEAVLKGLPCNT